MEALWLTVGLLFGVCFSAIGEQAIRELKSKINSKCPV